MAGSASGARSHAGANGQAIVRNAPSRAENRGRASPLPPSVNSNDAARLATTSGVSTASPDRALRESLARGPPRMSRLAATTPVMDLGSYAACRLAVDRTARAVVTAPLLACVLDGLPLCSHPRCRACGILVGPGHIELRLEARGRCASCSQLSAPPRRPAACRRMRRQYNRGGRDQGIEQRRGRKRNGAEKS